MVSVLVPVGGHRRPSWDESGGRRTQANDARSGLWMNLALCSNLKTGTTGELAAAGVAPHMLIDPDGGDFVEPAGVIDQHTLALGQHRVVRGVPRHVEPLGDPSDREVPDHDPFQRPPQATPGQLRPGLRGAAEVS